MMRNVPTVAKVLTSSKDIEASGKGRFFEGSSMQDYLSHVIPSVEGAAEGPRA